MLISEKKMLWFYLKLVRRRLFNLKGEEKKEEEKEEGGGGGKELECSHISWCSVV